MNAALHPLAHDYLRQVERSLAPLPRGRRDEVLGDLREHLDASLASATTEADVRNALDRLGEPREVARAALAEAGVPAQPAEPVMEWWALGLISLGSLLLPVAGWVAGIVMVWMSEIWTRRHKVLATLVLPCGFLGSIIWVETVARATSSTAAYVLQLVLVAVVVLAPFVTTLVLLVALGRHREATAL